VLQNASFRSTQIYHADSGTYGIENFEAKELSIEPDAIQVMIFRGSQLEKQC
jgi:hypothetical protein